MQSFIYTNSHSCKENVLGRLLCFKNHDVPDRILLIHFPCRDVSRTGLHSQNDQNKEKTPSEGKTAPPAKRQTNDAAKSADGAAGGKMPKWFAAGKKK